MRHCLSHVAPNMPSFLFDLPVHACMRLLYLWPSMHDSSFCLVPSWRWKGRAAA